jgi:predicted nucleotidyltransferase
MVLFGSWRTGTARPESSVDILIIAQTELRFMERIKLAIRTTEDDLPMIAPLVYTPQELKLLQHQGDGFIQSILAEGEILFEDGVGN